MISNVLREKGQKPYSVHDFMPADKVEFDPIEETWENLRKLSGA